LTRLIAPRSKTIEENLFLPSKVTMIPPIPRLSDYDVSGLHGFLPTEPPLELLPDPYYAPWEMVLRNLQSLMLTKRLRPMVDRLPVLDTDALRTEPEWRRAYLVLGFLAHAYIWGGETPCDVSLQ
jgi:indoleamine 2,3-dioxygenase